MMETSIFKKIFEEDRTIVEQIMEIVVVESPEIFEHQMASQFVMVVAVWDISNGMVRKINQLTVI